MKSLMKWLLLGLALSSSAAGAADDKVVQEDDKVVFNKKTVIDFSDVSIEGELTKPEGSYIKNRKKTRFRNLIELRGKCEDVLIANPADPKLRPFIPEWLRGSLNQRTLMLLPLRNGEDIPGVICGIGKDEHSLERMSRFNEALKLMRTELMRVNLKRAA